jgi:hypothetical protein
MGDRFLISGVQLQMLRMFNQEPVEVIKLINKIENTQNVGTSTHSIEKDVQLLLKEKQDG